MLKGGLGNMMKQAQKMQEDMQRAQEELAKAEVTGEAGGGMVKMLMNGKHAVLRVSIDPSIADDLEMVEDLVAAAANDAVAKVQKVTEERMADVTGGLNIPGMKLPF